MTAVLVILLKLRLHTDRLWRERSSVTETMRSNHNRLARETGLRVEALAGEDRGRQL
ncbi:MAG TPA: hypothetical protein VNM72_15490 [Blastocatellia bacterium]|nr:hypothetical protein [Blastocatellia bacterium]